MIKLIRITDGQDSRLEHLVPLYEEAFCSSERRTVGQLRRMIRHRYSCEQADRESVPFDSMFFRVCEDTSCLRFILRFLD